MSREAALLAGQCYDRYLRRGGTAHHVLADFLIGAHARFQADRLLARDRGYLRDYFTGLRLLQPAQHALARKVYCFGPACSVASNSIPSSARRCA